jgi:hypothetical protein
VVAHVGETMGGSRSGIMGAAGGAATMRCAQSGTMPGARTRGGVVAVGQVDHFGMQVSSRFKSVVGLHYSSGPARVT